MPPPSQGEGRTKGKRGGQPGEHRCVWGAISNFLSFWGSHSMASGGPRSEEAIHGTIEWYLRRRMEALSVIVANIARRRIWGSYTDSAHVLWGTAKDEIRQKPLPYRLPRGSESSANFGSRGWGSWRGIRLDLVCSELRETLPSPRSQNLNRLFTRGYIARYIRRGQPGEGG
ncbi:hypothetical protein GQ53DRAFT_525844 [Thozetella sp. PMI_491]|nr:hypothetical protein GQ53DRAFT_525844 [Thozetella sp. PMI_491]